MLEFSFLFLIVFLEYNFLRRWVESVRVSEAE